MCLAPNIIQYVQTSLIVVLIHCVLNWHIPVDLLFLLFTSGNVFSTKTSPSVQERTIEHCYSWVDVKKQRLRLVP